MTKAAEPKEINFVHKQKILAETVRKENLTLKIHSNFGINPFTKIYALAEKPNVAVELNVEDDSFKSIINRASLEPTKKYAAPATSNQEYGWISKPLLDVDKTDPRLYFPKLACEITKFGKFTTDSASKAKIEAPKA